jgi:hypothetical protein
VLSHNHIYDYGGARVGKLPKILCARGSTGAGVALAALRRGHVDAVEEQGQVRRAEFEAGLPYFAIGAGCGIEFLKSAGLKPLGARITLPSYLGRYKNV